LANTGSMNLNYYTFEKVGSASLQNLTVSPATASLKTGASIKLIATATDADNNELTISPLWSVDNGASINNYGVFQAFSEGTYTVTATVGEMTETATITVSAAQEAYSITFVVKNFDNGTLSSASINLQGFSATTNSSGEAIFYDFYPADELAYSVSRTGYYDTTGTTSVVDDNVSVNVLLRAIPAPPTNASKEINYSSETNLFPNPVNTGFVTLTNSEGSKVSIIDLTGKTWGQYTITENIAELNITHLKTGIYLIKIQKDSSVLVKRLIVE
jgi:hypothetical protein